MTCKSSFTRASIILLIVATLANGIHAQTPASSDVHNILPTSNHTTPVNSIPISQKIEAEVGHDHDHAVTEDTSGHVHDEHTHVLEGEAAPSAAGEEDGHGHAHGMSCEAQLLSDYNMSFRIGSIFIILGASAFGIFFPIIAYRIRPYKEGSIREWMLTAAKFFGTGVIIATAFIHMLPEGLEKFDSECIGEGWHSFPAFGGLFCLIASFLLQLVELAALSNLDALAKKNAKAAYDNESSHHHDPTELIKTTAPNTLMDDAMSSEKGLPPANHEHNGPYEHCHHGINEDGHVHSAGFLESEQSVRKVGTFILEMGIVMHSIIIGITLGSTDESAFRNLLIALAFHQLFEGLALGTRINDLHCKSWKKPIIMGLLFIVMTPIGIAIGIGIRNSVAPGPAILAQGILDSLSAGILLYNAYVSLMSIEINHNVAFRKSSLARKAVCFLSMYVGAGLMAVLGIWA